MKQSRFNQKAGQNNQLVAEVVEEEEKPLGAGAEDVAVLDAVVQTPIRQPLQLRKVSLKPMSMWIQLPARKAQVKTKTIAVRRIRRRNGQ